MYIPLFYIWKVNLVERKNRFADLKHIFSKTLVLNVFTSLVLFFFCSSCKKGEIQKPDPFTRNVSLRSSTGPNKTTACEYLCVCVCVFVPQQHTSVVREEAEAGENCKDNFFVFVFRVLKDQWIRAKYERREFTGESNHKPLYCSGYYSILLNSIQYYIFFSHAKQFNCSLSLPRIVFESRPTWGDTVEKGQRQQAVSKKEVSAVQDRLHSQILH